MSLDDFPGSAPQRSEADTVVRRVDRAAPYPDKITRAEELRLQLADEIVRGALAPGSALDETDIARRFNVSRTPVPIRYARASPRSRRCGRRAGSPPRHGRVRRGIWPAARDCGIAPAGTVAMRSYLSHKGRGKSAKRALALDVLHLPNVVGTARLYCC
jgi:hypothetical protein